LLHGKTAYSCQSRGVDYRDMARPWQTRRRL